MADAGLRQSRLALTWLVAGEWRWHPGRFAATAIAIAVGVALGFAEHLVNGSALASFEQAVTRVNGAADLQVVARTPLGFDERLYPSVATGGGVADASPVVSLPARAGRGRFTPLGLDMIRAAGVTPTLVGIRPPGPDAAGDGAFADDALFLSRAALAATGARVGEHIQVTANRHSATMRVVGTLPGAPAIAKELGLEHGEGAVRLDRRNLTIVADTLEGPLPLSQIGSGANWVGYHVAAHLAIHHLFRARARPVPAFLMLDQPSQAHYPPERDVGEIDGRQDEDQRAVTQLFRLLYEHCLRMAPDMQVIVVDHVELLQDWFREATKQRWRDGIKLVPMDWLR